MKKRINLINARKELKLTQGQLGAHIGITKQAMSSIENAITSTTASNWDELEDLLEVPQRALREVFEVEEVYHAMGKAG